jgi:hypothetical protein
MTPDASGPFVFRPSLLQRSLFVAAGVGGGALMAVLAFTNSPVWIVFALCAVPVVLEGVRTKVVVDRANGEVVSTRAFRPSAVAVTDVVNVRVPPWGPVALALREGASKAGGGVRRGQVLTGLYAGHRGTDPVAARLADALGVPVVSVWPAVRSDGTCFRKGPP